MSPADEAPADPPPATPRRPADTARAMGAANTRLLKGLSAEIAAPDPERRFHRYEILGEISRGGMGIVYRARHPDLQQDVALKVIREESLTESAVARFKQEAAILARLSHPAIVPVHDAGVWDGRPYFTMALIEGRTLEQRVRSDGPVPVEAALRLAAEVARGLAHAHAHGVVHRDVKPANILLDADERPHLTDFGLAIEADPVHRMTQTGTALGTPLYMAPEQAAGHGGVDPRVDVSSLGAVCYEMLSGAPPFRGENLAEVIHAVIEREPAPLNSLIVGLPRDAVTVVEAAMAKLASQRYESADALADDCERFLRGERVSARPPRALERAGMALGRHRRVLLALALLAAAAAGAAGALLIEHALRGP